MMLLMLMGRMMMMMMWMRAVVQDLLRWLDNTGERAGAVARRRIVVV